MDAARLRLMIVEDEAAHAAAIRRVLEAAGMAAEILVLGTLREYRAAVAAAAPDIALMDMNLPDGRALEVLTSPPEAGAFPVLVMTSYGSEQTVVEALKAGALDYVVKSAEAFGAVPGTIARALREWDLLQARKRAEEALRESEARFRTLVQQVPAVVYLSAADEAGTTLYISPQIAPLLGYTPEEWVAEPMLWQRCLHPDDRERVLAEYERMRATGEPMRCEYRTVARDGRTVWVEEVAVLSHDAERQIALHQGLLVDITERKRAEQALAYRLQAEGLAAEISTRFVSVASTELEREIVWALQSIGEHLQVDRCYFGTYSADHFSVEREYEWCAAGRVPQSERFIGMEVAPLRWSRLKYARNEPLVVARLSDLPPEAEAERELWQALGIRSLLTIPLHRGQALFGYLGFSAEGEERDWLEEDISLLRLLGEVLVNALARKQSDEALKTRALILESMVEGVLVLDKDGKIVFTNPALDAMCGYAPGELIGQPVFVLNDLDPEAALQQSRQIMSDVQMNGMWSGELRNRRQDGSSFISYARISALELSGRQYQLELKQDIIERKQAEAAQERLQAQLMQAQKMEAVGRLTAGIAHDFNNLLTVIMGFAELMKYQLMPGDSLHEPLDKITHAGNSAANLIQQLMAFSRQQVLQPQVLQLNAVLERMGAMLRRIIGEDVVLEIAPAVELWPVKVDSTQLQQVIVNLVVNGREAMPQGGRLRIDTANVTLDESQAAGLVEARPGDYVTVCVGDTGQGISPEVQAHIFEPFYTTKAQGTGLGLATVYGIVAQSGGFIDLQSAPGQGTTFTVYLPRAGEAEPVAARVPVAAAPRGAETILLVEDSDEVREYASKVLRGQGYVVLEADCGQDALRTAAGHAGPIHLLVTDVVMPDISGRAVAQRLAELRPDLKILYMSGYTHAVLENYGGLGAGVAFLQKPFSALDLAHTARRILDEPLTRSP